MNQLVFAANGNNYRYLSGRLCETVNIIHDGITAGNYVSVYVGQTVLECQSTYGTERVFQFREYRADMTGNRQSSSLSRSGFRDVALAT